MAKIDLFGHRAGLIMDGSKAPLALYLGDPAMEGSTDWLAMIPVISPTSRLFLKSAGPDDRPERYYIVPRPTMVSNATGISVWETDDPDWLVLDLTDVENDRVALLAEDGNDFVLAIANLRDDRIDVFTTKEDYDFYLCREGFDGLPIPYYHEGGYSFSGDDFVSIAVPVPQFSVVEDSGT